MHLILSTLIRSFIVSILSVINGFFAIVYIGHNNSQVETHWIDLIILVISMGFVPYFLISIFTSISWLQLITGTLQTGSIMIIICMFIFCGVTQIISLINEKKITSFVYSLKGFFIGIFMSQFLSYYIYEAILI